MSKHTPGPWSVNSQAGYAGHCVQDSNRRSVAPFPSNSTRPEEERNANARLIAAAPDMKEACELFTEGAHDAVRALNAAGIACPASIALAAEKARAAIAKAEGTS